MAAVFIVETGQALSDSNSYMLVSEADDYNDNHEADATWIAATDDDKKKSLRIATEYLDAVYSSRWKGSRVSRDQALDWPRTNVVDRDGFAIYSDEVPRQLKSACAVMALRSLLGEDLLPDLASPGSVKRTRDKVGPVETETEYQGGNSPIKIYRKTDSLLSDLIYPSETVERG